ncbi:hypothetical protein WUBG_18485, partial [Wuchereria bancrofti]
MDINDNPPRFSSSIYTASVSANGIIDRPVIKIYATDNDTGKNAQISYHLVSISDGAYNNFWYDSKAHQLNAVGNLKAGERYEIEAREVNTTPIRSSEPISVTIHVMDINDNPPRFSSSIYTASVSANGIIDRPVIK